MKEQQIESLKLLEKEIKQDLNSRVRELPFVKNPYINISGTESSIRSFVTIDGFSPSLHEKRIVLTLFDQIYDMENYDYCETRNNIIAAFCKILEAQKTRQADAISYGFSNFPRNKDIFHLSVDKCFPEIVQKPKKQLEDTIINAIARAQNAGKYGGERVTHSSGCIISEHLVDEKWVRLISPTIKVRNSAGKEVARLRGAYLEINAPELPESVMVSMIGKKLGELAEVHPALNDRVMQRIIPQKYKGESGLQIGVGIEYEKITEVL